MDQLQVQGGPTVALSRAVRIGSCWTWSWDLLISWPPVGFDSEERSNEVEDAVWSQRLGLDVAGQHAGVRGARAEGQGDGLRSLRVRDREHQRSRLRAGGAGGEGQRARGQRLRGDGAGSGSHSRGWQHPATTGWTTSAHCIDAAKTLGAANVVGPLYSAVGRTWQQTADERKRDTDLLVEQLKTAVAARQRQRRGAVRRAAQPLRDQLHEPGAAGDRSGRPGRQSRVRHPARHVPHEHRGEVGRRRDPRRRHALEAPARLRERSRRARARDTCRGRKSPPRSRTPATTVRS